MIKPPQRVRKHHLPFRSGRRNTSRLVSIPVPGRGGGRFLRVQPSPSDRQSMFLCTFSSPYVNSYLESWAQAARLCFASGALRHSLCSSSVRLCVLCGSRFLKPNHREHRGTRSESTEEDVKSSPPLSTSRSSLSDSKRSLLHPASLASSSATCTGLASRPRASRLSRCGLRASE